MKSERDAVKNHKRRFLFREPIGRFNAETERQSTINIMEERMNINITFKGMEPSDSIKDYALDRTNKLKKFLPPNTTLNTIIQKDKVREIAEINFFYHGQNFTAKSDNEDIYSSIDKVVDKVISQLRRDKEKRVDHAGPQKGAAEDSEI